MLLILSHLLTLPSWFLTWIPQALPTLLVCLSLMILNPLFSAASNNDKQPEKLCDREPYPIAVHVHGLRNRHGTIKAKLYGDNPDDFLASGKKLDSKRTPATLPSTNACLYAPGPGTYAIVVHHDENGNKKLDRNWIGMPVEGVGFSNDPQLFLAPPNHDEVAFSVTDGVTHVDITLQY